MTSSLSGARSFACPVLLSFLRLRCLVCLLLANLAYGQTAAPAAPPAVAPPAGKVAPGASDKVPAAQVGPDDPVITVSGFCAHPAQPDDACKTVITRAQFEKLTEALQPGMSLSLRLKVANAYARNMRMAAAAEKRALDQTLAFEEEMRYARMQLLSQDLTRVLQEEANRITDADIGDYYRKNQSSFEQATLARIFVPHAKQGAPSQERGSPASAGVQPAVAPNPEAKASAAQPDEAKEKAGEAAMTQLAADLRARAANGEDPDKLQIEAYTAAGIPGITPNTKMEKVRRSMLPPRHEAVMDLNPGGVSEVFSDPGGAHFVYKMISKQTLTLEDAKAEIRSTISTQRYRDSIRAFQGDVVFSDAYFNPPGQSTTPMQRNPKERSKTPTTERDRD